MSEFKSVAMVRHRVDSVWETTRDALPHLVPYFDDVDQIVVERRTEQPDGRIEIVNRWRAKAAIPSSLSAIVRPEMLAWTDRALWDSRDRTCRFRIDTIFLPDRVRCSGTSRYEEAMGGRGTRVTFHGNLEVSARQLPGVPSVLEGVIARGIEAFVTAMIPGNLRKITEGVARHLDARGG